MIIPGEILFQPPRPSFEQLVDSLQFRRHYHPRNHHLHSHQVTETATVQPISKQLREAWKPLWVFPKDSTVSGES